MSDLQDIITQSALKAFEAGRNFGRIEAIEILQKHHDQFDRPTSLNYRAELRKIIKEIRNEQT